MKELILKILEQYGEYTSLSEGHYAYMIEGDKSTLNEIAEKIIDSLNSAQKEN